MIKIILAIEYHTFSPKGVFLTNHKLAVQTNQ